MPIFARAIKATLLLLSLSLAGCAGLGIQQMTHAKARLVAEQLAARHPAPTRPIAPFFTSTTEFIQLQPTIVCKGMKIGTNFTTLVLHTLPDSPGVATGTEDNEGDCWASGQNPMEARYSQDKLFQLETSSATVTYIYQYGISRDKSGQQILKPEKKWHVWKSLLAGEELVSEPWRRSGAYNDQYTISVYDFVSSQQDPRPDYQNRRIANRERLLGLRDAQKEMNAEIERNAAEVRNKIMQNYEADGPIDLSASIREHGEATLASLNSINQAAEQGRRIGEAARSATYASSPPSAGSGAYSSSYASSGTYAGSSTYSSSNSSTSTSASRASAPAEPPAYQDLCVAQGMQELEGHDYTDPAGYRGHCREWEYSRYQGGGWMRHVQPGSRSPLTPFPSRQAACSAAQAEQVEFENMRKSGLDRAKPVVERSPCVCETGLQEFKRTSNPNGWGCSIFYKEGS